MGVEIPVATALDAIRDLAEAMEYPVGSGQSVGQVFIYYPKMESPAEYIEVYTVANPTQTILIIMEQGITVSWKDAPRFSRKNDLSFQIQILRPWVTGEENHQNFRGLYEHVLNQLNRKQNAELGAIGFPGIRMREWSAEDTNLRDVTKVTSFNAVLSGDMDNQPTVAA